MTKDELIAEITMLREIVAMGHDRLAENQYIDMALMQSKVDAACQEVADLPPDDAAEIRQSLNSLLEDLVKYSSSVSQIVADDEAAGGDTGGGEG